MELDSRKLKILSEIVRLYIKTGEPVGSKALVDCLDYQISSATIRNDMSELSQLGFLIQPHTSAGRIPSHIGFRLYIDNLLEKRELSADEKKNIDKFLKCKFDSPEKLIEYASLYLAQTTGCASISTTPTADKDKIAGIEIVKIGDRTIVVLVISTANIMKSKMCRVDFDLTAQALAYISVLLKDKLVNEKLEDIDIVKIQTIAAGLGEYTLALTPVLLAAYEIIKMFSENKVMLEGQSNLFYYKELSEGIAQLFDFLSNNSGLLNIIDDVNNGVNVIIGKETNHDELAESSMLFAKYNFYNTKSGTLGLIGPTRIDYAKLIPYLEYFSSSMGNILEHEFFK